MAIERLFPTVVYRNRIPQAAFRNLNRQIEKESYVFRDLDGVGKSWSKKNYARGYTSYSSLADLHVRSSTFDRLKQVLDREVGRFAKQLQWNVASKALSMSTCWVNIMGAGSHHSFHLHPGSVVSGTYFVRIPKGAGPFKVEDPRIGRFMGTPPQRGRVRRENMRYVEFSPKPGEFILFESWLKHEVPTNHSKEDRISVSFNYEWDS
jgi:uncharacterized protein (TIGR02466 family)